MFADVLPVINASKLTINRAYPENASFETSAPFTPFVVSTNLRNADILNLIS